MALDTGKVLQDHRLASHLFGEGMAIFKDRIIQLTWHAGVGIVYDLKSFKETKRFHYEGEGWGLTHDGRRLILSDGSDRISFLDAVTFERQGSIAVRHGKRPIHKLNELEYVKGEILANIWETDLIARIDPGTGEVRGFIDLTTLRKKGGISRQAGVLNGIAYDAEKDRLFVTGKNWPKLFEIKLVAKPKTPPGD